jgi:hypothetical protein
VSGRAWVRRASSRTPLRTLIGAAALAEHVGRHA